MELDSIVCATNHQVSSRLHDEVAILELERGVYYGLSRVGARIWELIQQPTRVRDVQDRLVAEYDVDAERCRADLLELLDSLKGAGLVEERRA